MADLWGWIDNRYSGGADVWDDGLAGQILLADYFEVAAGGFTLSPPLLTNAQTFPAATVTVGAVTLTTTLFTNGQTFPGPTLAATYAITAPLFTNEQGFPAASVGSAYFLAAPLLTNGQTFPAATVASNRTISAALVTNTQTFHAPTVIADVVIQLFPPLLINGGAVTRQRQGVRPFVMRFAA